MSIGLLIGILIASFAVLFISDTKHPIIYSTIAVVVILFITSLIGIAIDNYDVQAKIAKYKAAQQTYDFSINDPSISEYERVAILQTTIEVNQEIAETKTYVNSWISFGVTKENKEAVNNLKLIGE